MRADHRWLVLPLLIAVCAARTGAWQTACDRICLTRIADAYFAAMAAHDPTKAPLAANVRFTEQTQVKPIGDGLWKTASEAPTTFKVYIESINLRRVWIADEEKGLVFGLEDRLERLPALSAPYQRLSIGFCGSAVMFRIAQWWYEWPPSTATPG